MQGSKLLDFFYYKWIRHSQFELHNYSGAHLLAGIIVFKLLPILTQGLHFAVFDILSRCIYGHHACVAISVIPQLPGCVA